MSRGPWLTAAFKAQMWRRWQAGETGSEIAQALGKYPSQIHTWVQRRGGIAPLERRRSSVALTLLEREEISRGLCAGHSIRTLAQRMGGAPSSVSREIVRHGGRGGYRATQADAQAWRNARRPKACRLAQHPTLARTVAEKLGLKWSPQQIAGWLERTFGNDESMRVSHETIYRSLFIQARGVLKKELLAHLRRGHSIRHARGHSQAGQGHGSIVDAISIGQRPAKVEDRAVPGHWEGDLLCGPPGTQIATLVERRSRFVMLVKLPSKDSHIVASALARFKDPETSLTSQLLLLPSITQSGRYRAKTNISLRHEIVNDFYLDLTFNGNYDNEPPTAGADSFDYTVSTSLGYKF